MSKNNIAHINRIAVMVRDIRRAQCKPRHQWLEQLASLGISDAARAIYGSREVCRG